MAAQGYIPNKPLPVIEQNFKKGGFGSIDNFISNEFDVENSGIGKFNPAPLTQNNLKATSFQFLNDNGNGRISSGVTSLATITKILKGVPVSSATLFDQILYTDPYAIQTVSHEAARAIIYTNLGITAFVNAAATISPSAVTSLNTMVDSMIKNIKNLTFTYDAYIQPALFNCKTVVKAAVNSKG